MNEIAEEAFVAVKSFTGTDTSPKDRVAVATLRAVAMVDQTVAHRAEAREITMNHAVKNGSRGLQMRRLRRRVRAVLATSLTRPSRSVKPRGGALAALALAASLAATARADEAAFHPTPSLDLEALAALVATRSRAVQTEALAVDAAATEARQARLLGNPQLDGSWATIPVGQTNPPGLSSRMSRVPSYGVGVSYTFLLGKRGPRQRRADALESAARATVAATTRAQALALARVLGTMAVASMRAEGLRALVEEQRGSIALAEVRLRAGFATPLDLDRLQIELSRVEQQVSASETEARLAEASCAGLLGQRCVGFASADEARAFVSAWTARAERATPRPEARPDVRALDAARRAMVAEAELARATRIPDPTVRVGYLYDQFVISGNQRHSFNLSVAIPLPVFDGGGVQRDGALARGSRLSAERGRLLAAAAARVLALRDALASQRQRSAKLATEVTPRARAVVADLEKAAGARLIPLTDVIQARRTLSELLIQQAETDGDAYETSLELLTEAGSERDEAAR